MKNKVNTKTKNKGGRPSKFKVAFCDALVKFFDKEPYKIVQLEKMTEYNRDGTIKKESTKSRPMAEKLPTFYRFADTIGVEQGTLLDWVEKYPEFKQAFTRAKELQKDFLINLGLSGTTPPAAFIFVASNVTDMRSRSISQDELPAGSVIVPVIIRRGEARVEQLPEPEEKKSGITVRIMQPNENKKGN